jgi:hypothetical protein
VRSRGQAERDRCCVLTDPRAKVLEDRLTLLKPRLIIAESVFWYNGREHSIVDKLNALVARMIGNESRKFVIVGARAGLNFAKRVLSIYSSDQISPHTAFHWQDLPRMKIDGP